MTERGTESERVERHSEISSDEFGFSRVRLELIERGMACDRAKHHRKQQNEARGRMKGLEVS